MRANEFVTERKKHKRKSRYAAYGPGPYGGYGYYAGYSGDSGAGGDGGGESIKNEDAMMGKIADSGKIIRILKKAHTVPFSDEKNWLLIDTDPGKGNSGLGIKWIPADTRFEWVRPYRDTVEQGVAEGLIDYAQRKLGLKWGKIGDVVNGSVVAEYLDSQDDSMDTDRYINSKFKLINITANEAEKYREISDLNGWPSDTPLEKVKGWGIDNYKMDRIRKNDVTYQSLMKHTPVVSSRGFIINGNHRVARALEMGIDPIPILKELQQGVAEGLNEASSDEAWELIGQPVPKIQQFVKQMGYGNDEQSIAKITSIIDRVPATQIPAASIPKLKNLANKGNDAQTLKSILQISGRPDAEQQYTKLMQARDAGEGRNRDVSGYIQYVKSGNYDPPVLLKLPTGVYVIGGRTRLYAALALGVPANVKIISVNNFKQGVAENFADGRNPQDKGDSKRHGVPTKASVSTLRKVAKQGGRKGQLSHWMANMKSGRSKKK